MASNTVPNESNQHDDVRVILRRTERFAADITGLDVYVYGHPVHFPFDTEQTAPARHVDVLVDAGFDVEIAEAA